VINSWNSVDDRTSESLNILETLKGILEELRQSNEMGLLIGN